MIVGHGQPTERFRLARSSSQAFMFVSTGTLAFSLSTSLVFINALQTDFGFGGGVGLTCLNVSAWILAIAFFAAVMWSLQCARRKIQKETRQVKPDRLASVWSEIDDYDPNDTIQRKLDKAYFCIVICLFCAVALTWILTTYPSFFNGTSMRWFGAVAGLVTCLGLPGITFVMLARALPGMNQEPQLSALPSPPISRVNQVPGALARLVVISFAVIIVAHRYFTDRLH
ncbi:hypothetical protein AWC27_19745 [Mycobacterium szulgai]|uniref:Uncharacterized protein n=2 Tax=Mycobacterium szulgai TaxID=1787 RepID=A0A1X2F6V7_MYCSZ|nr:hypothetical protein AWC27_19745 [Mycobacterium szulgai]